MEEYISRCKRKFRDEKELNILSKGGITDLFDNQIKLVYRITDDEYDYLCECLSDEEIGYFVSEDLNFSEKRVLIKLLEKHLENYYNKETNY